MQKQLYASIILTPTITINQYIIPSKIHEEYTDMTCYGVCIEMINERYGGGTVRSTTQLDNLFCKCQDAVDFMEYIRVHKTKPENLESALKHFVSERYLIVV